MSTHLTASLRRNRDWDCRGTDVVAQRMIEQERQALEVTAMTDSRRPPSPKQCRSPYCSRTLRRDLLAEHCAR